MKLSTKIIILISLSLIIPGLCLIFIGRSMGGRVSGVSFNQNLKPTVYSTQIKTESDTVHEDIRELEAFSSINLNTTYANISIEASDHFGLEYRIRGTDGPSVSLKDGTLNFTQKEPGQGTSGELYIMGGTISSSPKTDDQAAEYVRILLPRDTSLTSLNINSSNGSITLSDFSTEHLNLFNEYGNSTLTEIQMKDTELTSFNGTFTLTGLTGDTIILNNEYGDCRADNTAFTRRAELRLDHGVLNLEQFSSPDVLVSMMYGDCNAYTLTADALSLTMNNGHTNLSDLKVSNLNIEAEYGNVTVQPSGSHDYSYELTTEYGEITVHGQNKEKSYQSDTASGESIKINCQNGDISIR